MIFRGLLLVIGFLLICYPSQAATYLAQGDIIGDIRYHRVVKSDNVYEIARNYDIGIVELLAANPRTDPWQPQAGKRLTLATMHVLPPGERTGIVINLSEMRLFYFDAGGEVLSFPIGIGREGWQTPLGKTTIRRKRVAPTWTPPPSIRAENPDLPASFPPGPDNPLGDYALDLGLPGILIHGTNRPYGIGKRSSHGCIRLYPEDIKMLFARVAVGTPVRIMDSAYKLGWKENVFYLEVTPTQQQADVIAEYKEPLPHSIPELYDLIAQIAGETLHIDWYAVEEAMARRDGIPRQIGRIIIDKP